MNTQIIDAAFAEMINERGVHNKLGKSSGAIRQYRMQLKEGIPISLDLKVDLLQKSGWKQDNRMYSYSDLVSLAKFTIRTSAKAREFGPEYVVEKWESTKKNNIVKKEDRQLILETSAKAILSLVPVIGGVISSILGDVLQDRKDQRFREFLDGVRFDLEDYKAEVRSSAFIKQVDFLDLFEKTSIRVMNERSEEKRIAYKNIIVHGIISPEATY